MKKFLLLAVLLLSVFGTAQVAVFGPLGGNNTWTGADTFNGGFDASGSIYARPFVLLTTATLPVHCTANRDVVYVSDAALGARAKVCNSTGNGWDNISSGGGGGGAWGAITGTLSDQTDLQTALNAKLGSVTINTTSPLGGGSSGSSFTLTCTGCLTSAVTNIATTAPLGGGPITGTGTISIANAAADGATKGAASFTATDFDAASGNISIDYTNGQKASGSVPGFLSSTDWTTFNNKGSGSVTSVTASSPLTGGAITTTGSIGISDAAADGTTKGASTYTAADFNAAAGLISLDYTNGQASDGSHKGFLTSGDWTAFNSKQAAIAGNTLSAHNFANSINSAGTISGAQPAAADLSDGTTGSGTVVESASPALTGTPTAPTATAGTSTTQIATTAFVTAATPNAFAWGGDGSDSSATADGSTTLTCLGAPASSIYTMTRDCVFTTLTVNNGVTIKTNNFALFVSGTLTNSSGGIIQNNGATGSNGSSGISSAGANGGAGVAGAGVSTGRYARLSLSVAGTNGGAGGTAAGTQAGVPNVGNSASSAVDSSGASGLNGNAGGVGGTGTSGAGGAARSGGTAGTVSSIASSNGHNSYAAMSNTFVNSGTFVNSPYTSQNAGNGGAPGGSGGGGDTTNSGGGGGGGAGEGGSGGVLAIFAKVISNTGTISANGGTGGVGGNGFTPTLGNTGGGGGGAGGSGGKGGIVWLVYQSLTNTGTISANGGTHGNGGTKGSPHGSGTDNAAAGSNGPDGPAGIVIQIAN